MILDDIFTVGELLVGVGTAVVLLRQQGRIQELEGFRAVQEEMQRRGCRNVRELDQAILNEIHQAEEQRLVNGPTARQRALPAPQEATRRAQKVPVKGTARPYNANQEAYTDDVETVRVQQPRKRNARAYPREYYEQ